MGDAMSSVPPIRSCNGYMVLVCPVSGHVKFKHLVKMVGVRQAALWERHLLPFVINK